jgi:hypothetical protein
MTRVPASIQQQADAYLANARRIHLALTGNTTLHALTAAEQAADRQPTKAELRMMLRAVAHMERVQARRDGAADDFAIPAFAS